MAQRHILVVWLALLFVGGCVPYVTFPHSSLQTPAVLDQGQSVVGANVAMLGESGDPTRPKGIEWPMAEADILWRTYVGEDYDLGARVLLHTFRRTSYSPGRGELTFIIDGRRRIPLERGLLAVAIPLSYTASMALFGAHPTVLFGLERAYLGLRCSVLSLVREGSGFYTSAPTLILGASVGDRLRLLPEVELSGYPSRYGGGTTVEISAALGISYQFGPRSIPDGEFGPDW